MNNYGKIPYALNVYAPDTRDNKHIQNIIKNIKNEHLQEKKEYSFEIESGTDDKKQYSNLKEETKNIALKLSSNSEYPNEYILSFIEELITYCMDDVYTLPLDNHNNGTYGLDTLYNDLLFLYNANYRKNLDKLNMSLSTKYSKSKKIISILINTRDLAYLK